MQERGRYRISTKKGIDSKPSSMQNMQEQENLFTFSIVTPSYNQGEFLEDTIKSVISQKGNFYIDYIIMDGGSTDTSINIIEKYEKLLRERQWPVKCKGINYRWVSEKDKGQVDAIEKGFAIARGDIGVWLNSDDIFYSDTVFETVAKYFNAEDVDLVIGNGIIIDRKGHKIGDYRTREINFKELVFLDYHILQPSAFLKIHFLKKPNFDNTLIYTFDVEFFIRLIRSGIKYKKVLENFSCFRIYPEIKTMSGLEKRHSEFFKIAKQVTKNPFLLSISWIYKYLEVVIRIKYSKSKFIQKIFPTLRNIFYLVILGTWGRK